MIKTDEIRARWSKVLPYPWRAVEWPELMIISESESGQLTKVAECSPIGQERGRATWQAISKAPEDIAYLLGEVDRLQRENADMYQRAYYPDARY